MRVFELVTLLIPDCFNDATTLRSQPVTEQIAGQLYHAVGSIAANLGEGYSRSSGKDRTRLFEYALGSVRESMSWYRASEPVLGREVVKSRLNQLEEMRRLLLAIIPPKRGRSMKR